MWEQQQVIMKWKQKEEVNPKQRTGKGIMTLIHQVLNKTIIFNN